MRSATQHTEQFGFYRSWTVDEITQIVVLVALPKGFRDTISQELRGIIFIACSKREKIAGGVDGVFCFSQAVYAI